MNKYQKNILIRFLVIITITVIAVVAMINFKDWANRFHAMQAMQDLGKVALEYRQKRGALPSESYIKQIKQQLRGHVRIGKLHYRALWIDSESEPNEILAYTEKNYKSLILKSGIIVLTLDGKIQWMDKEKFQTILKRQQSPAEIQMQKP